MTPASVRLDNRDHRALVAEARRRVAILCPELAVNGAADPTAALIELFTWMTGLAVERLDMVPDKLHVALLDLLGIELDGPAAAHADLRLRLSAPPAEPLEIRAGTEAGTLRTATQESIVFGTSGRFIIPPLLPAAYLVQRAGAAKEIGVADGVAYPTGPDQIPFSRQPQIGDALYLGFEESLSRLLMRVSMEASMARGAGVKPDDPPLRWEVSLGDGRWAEVDILEDLTGGFNYGSGTVEVQCPPGSGTEAIAGRRLFWLRCRIAETTRVAGEAAVFTQAPEIYQITAAPTGALLPAEHSTAETEETIGVSDGTPAQTFATRFAPVLALAPGETLEVKTGEGDWEAWEQVDSFAGSGVGDRHFGIDLVHGQLRLGPELRDADGGVTLNGAIPAKGAILRMCRYRHGGGRTGNVDAGTISVLRSAIPGVASVTNPRPALGGVDPESLQSARQRSALQIRTRYRAVTAEDYEFLATEATPRVARALRVVDDQPGVTLRILPRVDPADHRLTFEELTPDELLLEEIQRYVDARKLPGTPVRLLPMRFRAVSVVVNLQVTPRADAQRIERHVRDQLYTYLNPMIGGNPEAVGSGWPPGRSLNQGELYAIMHAFDAVETVKILRLYEMDLATGERDSKAAGRQVLIEPDEVVVSGDHVVRVARRED
ncbi:MAG TPA: putative baseplate assembly protein [Solirubrobacteraceae bacterium]|nr:putative baseplate assembly protein [Solirubrobacteraceae bacterium]